MPNYIEPPIETDTQLLLQQAYEFMQANVAGWSPKTATLDVWVMMSTIFALSMLRDTASKAPTSIYRYLGTRLLQLEPLDATQAYTTVTFTAVDTAGHVVEAGTQVGIPDANGTLVGFYTFTNAIIPVGSSSVSGVEVLAAIPGAAGTDLGGAGEAAVMLDSRYVFIASVTTDAATTGGTDAESDEEYLDHLTGQFQLLSPAPILPTDFAAIALNVDGNFRATAVAGYNPLDGTENNERVVTVFLTDENGDPRDSTAKAATVDYIESLREQNFVGYAADPTYTNVNVIYTAKAVTGFDPVDVKSACDVAIQGYLDPASWGSRPRDRRAWDVDRIVRYNELMHRISNVVGVDYVLSLAIGTTSPPASGVDVQLTGIAPLPRVGTITGAVI